jgi:hypothetical protein
MCDLIIIHKEVLVPTKLYNETGSHGADQWHCLCMLLLKIIIIKIEASPRIKLDISPKSMNFKFFVCLWCPLIVSTSVDYQFAVLQVEAELKYALVGAQTPS